MPHASAGGSAAAQPRAVRAGSAAGPGLLGDHLRDERAGGDAAGERAERGEPAGERGADLVLARRRSRPGSARGWRTRPGARRRSARAIRPPSRLCAAATDMAPATASGPAGSAKPVIVRTPPAISVAGGGHGHLAAGGQAVVLEDLADAVKAGAVEHAEELLARVDAHVAAEQQPGTEQGGVAHGVLRVRGRWSVPLYLAGAAGFAPGSVAGGSTAYLYVIIVKARYPGSRQYGWFYLKTVRTSVTR